MPKSPLAVQALDRISWSTGSSSSIALMGKTGSGKSTLAQLTNGVLMPSQGKVTVDGLDTRKRGTKKRIRQKVGVSFQFPEKQFFCDTIYEEISVGMKTLDWPEDKQKEQIQKIADLLELPISWMKRSPYLISGGEKRLVGLASILIRDPCYLVLDEPIISLDSSSKRRVLALLEMMVDTGKLLICITHDPAFACEFFGRWVVLQAGQIVYDGSSSDYPLFSSEAVKHGILPTRDQIWNNQT
jgi:energy-coupling factor transport system ATP-binding protein